MPVSEQIPHKSYPANFRKGDCAWRFNHSLHKIGIDVKIQTKLLYRYAVIDQSIIWYGNIEYLSYSMKDANALRVESPDIAGELLDL